MPPSPHASFLTWLFLTTIAAALIACLTWLALTRWADSDDTVPESRLPGPKPVPRLRLLWDRLTLLPLALLLVVLVSIALLIDPVPSLDSDSTL